MLKKIDSKDERGIIKNLLSVFFFFNKVKLVIFYHGKIKAHALINITHTHIYI